MKLPALIAALLLCLQEWRLYPERDGSDLRLTGVNANDTARYSVTATNASGSATSSAATLTVK